MENTFTNSTTDGGFALTRGPIGFILGHVQSMLIGMVILAIILWAVSKVPLLGPWVRNAVLWLLTRMFEFIGIAKCGFESGSCTNSN